MTTDFTTTLMVDNTPNEVFDAINNVRGWWSEEIEGSTSNLNDEFTYHFEDIHRCTIEIIQSVPGQKVVWLVKENYFKPGIFGDDTTNDKAADEKSEWTGTTISFEIFEKEGKTELRFTHNGLVPEFECYNACSGGWTHYIGSSLSDLLTAGKGQPNSTGKPQTEEEERIRAEKP